MSLPFHSRAVQMPCPDSLEYPDSASLVRTHSRHETFKKQMESPFPLPTRMKKPLKHIYLKYEDTCEQWEPWPRNCTRVQSTADLPSESCTVSWCLRESNACDNNSIYLSLSTPGSLPVYVAIQNMKKTKELSHRRYRHSPPYRQKLKYPAVDLSWYRRCR